jgi:hypothetical protein
MIDIDKKEGKALAPRPFKERFSLSLSVCQKLGTAIGTTSALIESTNERRARARESGATLECVHAWMKLGADFVKDEVSPAVDDRH